MAQTAHAVADFWNAHGTFAQRWHDGSNYICIVSVPDQDALLAFADACYLGDVAAWTLVHEPDIDEHTSLALVKPRGRLRDSLSRLPLAGEEVK